MKSGRGPFWLSFCQVFSIISYAPTMRFWPLAVRCCLTITLPFLVVHSYRFPRYAIIFVLLLDMMLPPIEKCFTGNAQSRWDFLILTLIFLKVKSYDERIVGTLYILVLVLYN